MFVKKIFSGVVSDQEFNDAMKSFDLAVCEEVVRKIRESEGDTQRYHTLQAWITALKNMAQIVEGFKNIEPLTVEDILKLEG